jgi:phosphinothricin acetyltransferase
MNIEPLQPQHFEAVKQIYALGIATGIATFQANVPVWEEWDESHLKTGRLVALDEDGHVLGWAALTPVSGRCVYAGVAEVSIYVHPHHQGKGAGKALLKALIAESEKQNLWTLQAGIFPENAASLKIHQQCGFRQVGYREKIGQLKGIWRDTILLERRSQTVGI